MNNNQYCNRNTICPWDENINFQFNNCLPTPCNNRPCINHCNPLIGIIGPTGPTGPIGPIGPTGATGPTSP